MSTFFSLFFRLLALLPLRVLHLFGVVTGWLLYVIPHNYQYPTDKNLQICFPELTPEQRKALKKKALKELGKSVWEIAAIWFWPKQKLLNLIQEVHGQELLEQAFANKKGVILAVPHLGCWEMVGLYFSYHYPMTSMYRPPRIKSLDHMMRGARERLGASLVPTNQRGVRMLFQALRSNHLVGILPDQDPRQEGNVFAPFFGLPASTPILLPRLAEKTGATVLFAYAKRLPHSQGFHIHIQAAPAEIYAQDAEVSARAMNQGVESCVRALPEQYQWTYKRFKTRPPGEQKFY